MSYWEAKPSAHTDLRTRHEKALALTDSLASLTTSNSISSKPEQYSSCAFVPLFSCSADAAAHAAISFTHLASSTDPPSYAASFSPSRVKVEASTLPSVSHPRIAVFLGVNARWHIPLLVCRALSTAPAAWWGLRCAFTFLGELLRSDGAAVLGGNWTVEKRFRVTEVFLAILWVRRTLARVIASSRETLMRLRKVWVPCANRACTSSALRPLTCHTSLQTA